MLLLKRTYITLAKAATEAVRIGWKIGYNFGANGMWRLLKLLFVLAVLAAIAFVGYAYLGPIFVPGDFTPEVQEIVKPVTLGGDE